MRILIAEDDKSLANALVAILEKNNYLVDVVYNGLDALDYLENIEYDGAIVDIMMPIMDGLSMLKKIRQNKNTTPILLLSAKSQIDDKILGLDAGASDYLTKPFDVRELLARLRVLTRKNELQFDNYLTYGNISLDTKSYKLIGPKGEYLLANKEFQTMLLLMRNPGVLLNTERFLENIWDEDSKALDNTVWTYISYLRRKLEALDADINIATMRNAGYILKKNYEK